MEISLWKFCTGVTGFSVLTVELQDGVVDLALELSGALGGARHPQSLVHGHCGDDVVPEVRGHLPLRQNCPDDQSDDAD